MKKTFRQFQQSCRQNDTTQVTTPDEAHLWLHAKSLDAIIGHVPTPYCPGSRHGHHHWHG
jgi:hypothetical protein